MNYRCFLWAAVTTIAFVFNQLEFLKAQAPIEVGAAQPSVLIEQEAVAGEPFGTGRISMFLGEYDSVVPPRVQLVEREGRIYYPASNLRTLPPPPRTEPAPARRPIGRGGLIERLRNAAESARHRAIEPKALDIDFLFLGSENLSIKILDARGTTTLDLPVLAAASNIAQAEKLKAGWLDAYARAMDRDRKIGDFPTSVQTFVLETMARRFNLAVQDFNTEPLLEKDDPLAKPLSTLELLASTERLREQVFRETLRTPITREAEANVAVPLPPQWINAPVPEVPDNLPIESIASVVPAECFYLRFGRFANYLWFREFSMGKGPV